VKTQIQKLKFLKDILDLNVQNSTLNPNATIFKTTNTRNGSVVGGSHHLVVDERSSIIKVYKKQLANTWPQRGNKAVSLSLTPRGSGLEYPS
jgi:hypothetical protein